RVCGLFATDIVIAGGNREIHLRARPASRAVAGCDHGGGTLRRPSGEPDRADGSAARDREHETGSADNLVRGLRLELGAVLLLLNVAVILDKCAQRVTRRRSEAALALTALVADGRHRDDAVLVLEDADNAFDALGLSG